MSAWIACEHCGYDGGAHKPDCSRPEGWLSVRQTAALAGCEPYSVNRAIREGRLPAVRVGKQNVIRRGDLLQYHSREYPRKEKVTG